MKAEVSDADPESTATVPVDIAREAQSGDQTTSLPQESKDKACANKNIIGRLNNLVTTDIQTITRGRDWLVPGAVYLALLCLRTTH